jgi:formylmethanofuran dehydrogenase subunit E
MTTQAGTPDYRSVYPCRDFREDAPPAHPLFGSHRCIGPCGRMFSEGELVEGYQGFVCHSCLEHDGSLAPAA